MADYAKKTVAELTEILKSRGLPSSGKKAELIARLNEHDKQVAEEAPQASEPEPTAAGESAEPVVAPVVATTSTAPTSELTSTSVQPPAEPTSTVEADHPSPDTALATQTSYSLNLPTSTLDTELAKRKARADRFGTGAATTTDATESSAGVEATNATSQADAAALKNLERAKRFGTGQTAIGKLDEALPSEVARGSRKRNHAAVAEATPLDDPGLKRSFMNRGRGRDRDRGGRHAGNQRGGGRGPPPAAGGKPETSEAAEEALPQPQVASRKVCRKRLRLRATEIGLRLKRERRSSPQLEGSFVVVGHDDPCWQFDSIRWNTLSAVRRSPSRNLEDGGRNLARHSSMSPLTHSINWVPGRPLETRIYHVGQAERQTDTDRDTLAGNETSSRPMRLTQ